MTDEQIYKPVIGWIGTGVMGISMCSHLIENGYTTIIYNRTKEKALPLIHKGAIWANSPKEVAEKAQIIFTIVGYPEDVEAVYFSTNGIFKGISSGKTVIDMTTTKPSLAVRIAEEAEFLGAFSLDAPVSGGDIGAREARLAIMVGGDESIFKEMLPLFSLLGKNIMYEGCSGSGQHTKMCNQITIAGTMIGMCEALYYGYKAGLSINSLLATISKGAAACWSLDNLAPRIAQGNFEPGFYIDHFIKDMGIALDEARNMHISLPGLALVQQMYIALQASGKGSKGTQALILALDQLNATKTF